MSKHIVRVVCGCRQLDFVGSAEAALTEVLIHELNSDHKTRWLDLSAGQAVLKEMETDECMPDLTNELIGSEG